MASNCTIAANPDIAGIGIRVSLYAQALLIFLPGILVTFCWSKSWEEAYHDRIGDDMGANAASVLITGCALLVSTIIQAQLYGLSLYHALIVLNLSWLNNISAFLPLTVKAGSLLGNSKDRIGTYRRALKIYLPYALHFAATGVYGLWLFCRISDFGLQSECNPAVIWMDFGKPVSATSPQLRLFFLVTSAMAAIPIVNVVLVWILIGLFGTILKCCCCGIGGTVILLLSAWVTGVVLLITGTEQLVSFNQPYLEPGEGNWTFGQTLALLLLFLPLWNAGSQLWMIFGGRGKAAGAEKQLSGQEKDGKALEEGGEQTQESHPMSGERQAAPCEHLSSTDKPMMVKDDVSEMPASASARSSASIPRPAVTRGATC